MSFSEQILVSGEFLQISFLEVKIFDIFSPCDHLDSMEIIQLSQLSGKICFSQSNTANLYLPRNHSIVSSYNGYCCTSGFL